MGLAQLLSHNDREREWVLDLNDRMAPAIRSASAALGVATLASLLWVPFVAILPMLGIGVLWAALDLIPRNARRVEWLLLGSLTSSLLIATALVLMHGQDTPAISLMFVCVIAASTGLPTRLVVPLAAVNALILVGIVIGFESPTPLEDTPAVLFALVSVLGVFQVCTAGRVSSSEFRSAAVLDPLTGMLNRTALAGRAHELSELSARNGQPVGVVIADIDHFKAVNDEHGHARGDAVLVDCAYQLRKNLRSFDHAYRSGGEEFVLLLPGVDGEAARDLAERLREAIADSELAGGVQVTASFGASASVEGSTFNFDDLFEIADAALYEAKRSGRNRVVLGGAPLPLAV